LGKALNLQLKRNIKSPFNGKHGMVNDKILLLKFGENSHIVNTTCNRKIFHNKTGNRKLRHAYEKENRILKKYSSYHTQACSNKVYNKTISVTIDLDNIDNNIQYSYVLIQLLYIFNSMKIHVNLVNMNSFFREFLKDFKWVKYNIGNRDYNIIFGKKDYLDDVNKFINIDSLNINSKTEISSTLDLLKKVRTVEFSNLAQSLLYVDINLQNKISRFIRRNYTKLFKNKPKGIRKIHINTIANSNKNHNQKKMYNKIKSINIPSNFTIQKF